MARKTIKDFARAHPFCCFCGGQTPTETRDEIPPRSMFKGRVWPEGYQFPACLKCNSSSRHADQALALIARMSFADRHVGDDVLTPYIRGVANNRPDLLPEVASSSIHAKKLLRQLGIKKPEGTFAVDFPVALIPAETMAALNIFFSKLFCSLYYKHTGNIVSKHTNIAVIRTTNQIYDDPNPFDWLHSLPFNNSPTIKRAGKSLNEQFDYKWGHNRAEGLFGFSFQLRYSIFGIVVGPITDLEGWPDGALLKTP